VTCERPRQHQQGFAKTFDLSLGLFEFWRFQKFPATLPPGDTELMGSRNVVYRPRSSLSE
jgi:hypothetical protein